MQAQDQSERRAWAIVVLPLFSLLFGLLHRVATGDEKEPSDRTLTNEYSQQAVDRLMASAKATGDLERGLRVFTQAKVACFSCHRIGAAGGSIGPDLTLVGDRRETDKIIESLLWPNRTIAPEFQPHKIVTVDGTVVAGYLGDDPNPNRISIRDPATGKTTEIALDEIEQRTLSQSLMPAGLVQTLTAQEQADLVRFLSELRKDSKLELSTLESAIRNASTHEPATFPLTSGPLYPAEHPAAIEFVNRKRVYDFYSKQAAYFAQSNKRPPMIESFPGLDGKENGHWGNQNEGTWRGNEWNDVILGSILCNVFHEGTKTIPRALCLRLGQDRAWSVVFNADTMAYEFLWRDGFVKFSDVRHGYMDGVRVVGELMPLPSSANSPIATSAQQVKYRGFYRHGQDIYVAYDIDGVAMVDAPSIRNGNFERIVAPKSSHPLRSRLSGGPPQWPQVFETRISYGQHSGLTVDTIELPLNNPWKTPLACGDHAFLADGTAIVVTMQGDVWRVEGLCDPPIVSPDQSRYGIARWRRIAAGLHHALGIVVHQDQIYVLGRNQITRLHDLNGDGEMDWYECFSNAFQTSPAGHDFICGLERDPAGNFYTSSGNQGIVQISADGSRATVLATGFRNPDGIGRMPDGTITVPCSEGDWTPTSMICEIIPKSHSLGRNVTTYETQSPPFYGYRGPREGQAVQLPLLYLPRGIDNSSGGQLWIDDPRCGPLANQILHTSFGAGTCFLILKDSVDGRNQGAAVTLPVEFRSGSHRARLNPRDGQIYVSGMNGWGTYTPDSGSFQRVRYTGDSMQLPVGFHVHANGITVRFSEPIDPAIASNAGRQFAQCWNYRYSPGYGSKEYSALRPPMIGHDVLTVASTQVLDERTLFVELPELQLTNQLHLRLVVDGGRAQELFATVHAMDEDRSDFAGYQAIAKQRLPHPIVRDLEWLRRSIPNPWQARIAGAREIRIEARENLQFSTKLLEVKPGEKIKLTFANPDVVPHNWALIRPGTLESFGDSINRYLTDPDAFLHHYVPPSDAVVCYTDVVDPGNEFGIYFTAPMEPGRYPYLCTFPGHWMVMHGELIVKPSP